MTNAIDIECPRCHKFTTIKESSGVYYGRCAHCNPGVRFSVIIIDRIPKNIGG